MAKITTSDVSNFTESLEPAVIAQKGLPSHWPPVHRVSAEAPSSNPPADHHSGPVEDWGLEPVSVADQKAAGVAPEKTVTKADQRAGVPLPSLEGGEDPSAGTSSSTSESKPDKSGSSAQETEPSSPSPAQTAESPSSPDPASKQAPSSTAPSTSGSTQETGASQPDPSPSSAEPQTPPQLETDRIHPLSGKEMIHLARKEYEDGNFEAAKGLLEDARKVDPSLDGEVTVALEAVQTATEQVPSAGGFLVQ